MNQRTLFLAWQDRGATRQWFPVGRLDANETPPGYRFRYVRGAERARSEAGFPLLLEFPEICGDYRDRDLFPLFRNRVINPKRPDRAHHLETLGLGPDADPIEILSTSGGRRVTDAYEVFPRIVKRPDGSFSCRFFLHGSRHVSGAPERVRALRVGQPLSLALELTNPQDPVAVQVQTKEYGMLGWAPRYLVLDLAMAMTEGPSHYTARVVRINRQQSAARYPVLSRERVLLEMRGTWTRHEPMSSDDYRPMVGDA